MGHIHPLLVTVTHPLAHRSLTCTHSHTLSLFFSPRLDIAGDVHAAERITRARDSNCNLYSHTLSITELPLPAQARPAHSFDHPPAHHHLQVPASTFELNFVLTDGEGRFENNSGQDFTYAVEGEWDHNIHWWGSHFIILCMRLV